MGRVLPDLAAMKVAALPSPSAAYDGQFRRVGGVLYFCDGTSWINLTGQALNDPWQYIVLGSNVAVSTTTFADVTGLAFTGAANTLYEVEVIGAIQTAATTTGAALALNIPSGNVIGQGIHNLAAATLTGWEQIADDATTGVGSGMRATGANVPIRFSALVSIGGTGGTVQLRLRSEIASSAVTLQSGLVIMKYRKAATAVIEPWSGTAFAPVEDIAGTSYTFILTDAGKYKRTTNGSAVTLTVPPQADVAWPDNVEIQLQAGGTGQITVAGGSGVTVNTSQTLKSAARYAVLALKRTGTNEWTLTGERELPP